jgi:hypothetical protein
VYCELNCSKQVPVCSENDNPGIKVSEGEFVVIAVV